MPARAVLLLGLLGLSCPLRAQMQSPAELESPELLTPPPRLPKEMEIPPAPEEWYLHWMIHPRRNGMLVSLPVIDTDPNRGTTVGVLPIWIIKEAGGGDRIEQMHAPSFTINRVFGETLTYRYYLYPTTKSSFIARAAITTKLEREIMAQYQTPELLGRDLDFNARLQYNVDASNRMFGLGPDSCATCESDYTEKLVHSEVTLGVPLAPESRWRAHVRSHYIPSDKITRGRTNLPDVTDNPNFLGVVPLRRKEINETTLIVDYDTRDDAVTTSQGRYWQAAWGGADDVFASQYDYTRYSLDTREFYKWPENPDFVTAVNYRYEQLLGTPPFWLLPSLGGKYSLRAYGDGRYRDRGSMVFNAEQRWIFWRQRMTGVAVEFELAPFVGVGTVFDNPNRMARRYARPVFGSAVRAIARPQVVGSIDFGYGQAGLAAFIDINYSF